MANQYVGERYVPLIMGEWHSNIAYERLSLVTHDDGDGIRGYISRIPVPAGTPVTNTDYWALQFDNTTNVTTVGWADIADKPTSYPPSAHRQDWNTIDNPPATYPPSAHQHPVSQILTLQDKLDDLQTQINNIKPTSGIASMKGGLLDVGTDQIVADYQQIIYDNGYMTYHIKMSMQSIVVLNSDYGNIWRNNGLVNPIFNPMLAPYPDKFAFDPVVVAHFQNVQISSYAWVVTEKHGKDEEVLPKVYLVGGLNNNTRGVINMTISGTKGA